METPAFPLPSSHLSHPESCFPAALPHSTTESCHALLHRRIQPAWGRGRGLSCRRGAGQVPTASALCPFLGSTSRNAGVLPWVGAVVSAPRDAAGCYMVWTPLSWENTACSGGSSPPAREGASLGTAGAGSGTKHPDVPVLPHGRALSRSQPAQWELSVFPSPSLLAMPCSQVRTLPLFAFFKINHFGG